MSKRDSLLSSIGGQMKESLGMRANESPGDAQPAAASPMDGRTRSRDAGEIDIDKVIPDPEQPRTEFSESSIEKLANSITDKGQLQPIRVRWNQELGKWVIISGERRYRATLRAGLEKIKCTFVEEELTEDEIFEEQLVENALREDLSPLNQAKAFRRLQDRQNLNASQIAQRLHISVTTVSRSLALLKLPDDVQEMVDTGELSPRATREVLKLKDAEQQRGIAKRIVKEGLTADQAAGAVARSGKRNKTAKAKKNSHTFTTESGAKVQVAFRRKVDEEEVLAALEQAVAHVQTRVNDRLEKAA